ncbi:iron uptake transporter deferrochelatase/peroxidase subunit [Bacillus sp. FJAT-26390]|uniref:iron uptake transporter deferrochelatase/peroxidase subunit n=1 Tax=Bacillus sp. FJAT-26390 TaxID=1743142 RepID=UPI000807AEEC|nr:iron uptake transporter deferrochelatase/peroxidase subunit [Bacillus sp. FJAT-26390]OBZ08699.1 deferrochelatase [Bacillus sp. FJAT-26390]
MKRPSDSEQNGQSQEEGKPGIIDKKISRRDLLRMAGVGGAGLLLGATGMGGLFSVQERSSAKPASKAAKADSGQIVDFYGAHQAGITTPPQDFIVFAAFDLTANSLDDVRKLFQAWTAAAAAMTSGEMLGSNNENLNLPPSDTGEAEGLSPSRTTITFGVGASFFDGRYGLAGKRPAALADLPAFGGDELREEWSGGDIGVQVNANDLQIAFHAIRNLARIARGKAVLRWTQEGFQRTSGADPAGATPRNLMGFKDGTNNPDVSDDAEMKKVVWAAASDGTPWMDQGSYMVVRRIRVRIEVWDRSTLGDQEATFGRHRNSGAPIGSVHETDKIDLDKKDEKGKPFIPMNSHIRLAHGDGSVKILRRSFSYSSGMDHKTGQLDAGLLFICFNRDSRKQFIPMQQKLGQSDLLNEYIVHTGSAMFACFPGVRQGGYIGETLF